MLLGRFFKLAGHVQSRFFVGVTHRATGNHSPVSCKALLAGGSQAEPKCARQSNISREFVGVPIFVLLALVG